MESKQESKLKGNEVVISGMSGIFPKSSCVMEFMENLYNKVDLVIALPPQILHPDAPKYLGKVDDLNRFDAQFFRVTFNQAMTLDPMCRKLMEHSYSAIYDAGINPLSLGDKKIAVYVGKCYMDSAINCLYSYKKANKFFLTGCASTMLSNRISYVLNATGPSFCVEGGDSTPLIALDLAYKNLSSGMIDGAIIGGCNICKQPPLSINIKRNGLLCEGGKTRCFDKDGDGCVRSEAISVMFLQKAKDAKRVYCEVYGTKIKYSKPDINTPVLRDENDIVQLLEEFYSEVDVDPSDVEYVEASATGVSTMDAKELKAINKVFGDKSKFKFGTVKSNMGNSEGAAGMCALTKICLAYHTGQIAATINSFNGVDSTVNAIPVKENTPFERGLVAVNDFSYTGIDCHALLKGYFKPKDTERYKSNIPYLVFGSGRQEVHVEQFFDILQSNSLDPEYIGMLHNIHNYETRGHTARGFIILDKDENKQSVTLSRSVSYYPGKERQVWFVFSGMGSQWTGMGADLMQIEIFSESIKKCDKILRPKGIDIFKIITEKDPTIFSNILNSFVGIAAIQIGLINILKAVGISCDYMIGHSVGELGCGYADGCLTADEMILSAYSRGIASIETNFIPGAMAAVGLGYKELCLICPPDIDIACHNSSNSSTISGPAEAISKFVKELNARGIFSKQVPTSNIAYHSRYIANAGPTLKRKMDEVIMEPKLRSNKWLSTSVTEDKWLETYAKYSSAEYFTNNLLNQVHFEETAKHIPSDSIVIEIAPHGLLNAILKRSHEECLHIPLTRRNTENQVKFLLEAIGKIYEAGVSVKIDALYPKIEYPVSTGTSFLSHIVKWEHSEDWPTLGYMGGNVISTRIRNVAISVLDEDYNSIQGNMRNGVIVFPESALLVLTWETLAMSMDMDYRELSVKFTNLKFYDQVTVNPQKLLNFTVCITKAEGEFEVLAENKIVSGVIKIVDNEKFRAIDDCNGNIKNNITLYESDIYKYLNLRGHVYDKDFRSLYSLTADYTEARVKWTGDWITFLDGLIQINILANNHNGISKVKLIESLTIDTFENSKDQHISSINDVTFYKTNYYKTFGVIRCGGVQLVNVVFDDIALDEITPNFVGTKQFWPHFPEIDVDINTALFINMQIIVDAVNKKEINVTELRTTELHAISEAIRGVSSNIPINVRFESIDVKNEKYSKQDHNLGKTEVLLTCDITTDTKDTAVLFNHLPNNGFVLTLEKKENIKYVTDNNYFNVITSTVVNSNYILALLKKNENQNSDDWIVVEMEDNLFLSNKLDNVLKHSDKRIVLVTKLQHFCDFTGYLKSLQENYESRISLFMILDSNAPNFDVNNNIYRTQLQKNVPFNVLINGRWGGYYYTSIEDCSIQNPIVNLKEKDLNILHSKETETTKLKNTIQVKYTGLSLRDSEKLLKNTTKNISYGMDFSGFDRSGNKVMGLITGGANSGEIDYDSDMLWPVPDHWTLEAAATVPLPFVHAYYCLGIRCKVRHSQRIFVSDGTSALGQAVIAICLSLNCDIYTTVNDLDEKISLLKLFPAIDGNKIISSEKQDLLMVIATQTRDKLCDIVINTGTGTSRLNAMKCVGFMGQFLDISDYDALENNKFGLCYLEGCKNYNYINVSNIFNPENLQEKKIIQSMVAEGIGKGIVKPLSYVSFSNSEVSKASKLLVSRRYTGKIVIKLPTMTSINNLQTRLTVNSSHTHMIIGEQDELCIGLIDFLVERGAKTICLNIEPKPITPLFNAKLITWKNRDVTIKITHHLMEDTDQCNIYLNKALESGPIEGIFILLNNNEIKNDSKAAFDTSIITVKNLDELSRDVESLRYFVVIARNITTVEDELSFTAYSKICQFRNYVGLPALLYRPEFVDEVENITLEKYNKLRRQAIQQVLNVLDTCIEKDYNNAISFNTIKSTKCDYLERLAGIIGTKHDKSELDEITTLNDYDNIKLNKISNLIRTFYYIDVPLDELKQMSLSRIYNIDRDMSKLNTNSLDAIISFANHDPYEGTDPMKLMITTINENLTTICEMEYIDPKADYLLLIPGYEGHHGIFKSLCLGLKYSAVTLQLGPDLLGDSISEMAENILKNLSLNFDVRDRKTFYLLGYSFGVNVALELAALLEQRGLVGVVFCLDSSPDILRNHLDAIIGNFTETELQNALVNHIYYLMTKETNAQLKEELMKCETFEEKTNSFIKSIKRHVSYPQEYMRLILKSSYKKILLAQKYNPTYNLDSQLILIKGTSQSNEGNMADYNLSKLSKKPIKVIKIDSDHATIPFDGKIPSVINNMLNVYSETKNKNINSCEKYFLEI